jgi:hypothetical protein
MDLFQLTMVVPLLAKNRPKEETTSATLLLQQLALMARKTNHKTIEETVENPTKETFLDKVKQRAVAPLSVLLRQGVTSRSDSVRMHYASLCQALLTDSRECWRDTTILDLALESCLILETDSEGTQK